MSSDDRKAKRRVFGPSLEFRRSNPHYLRADEAAVLLGVDARTVKRWIECGRLKGVPLPGDINKCPLVHTGEDPDCGNCKDLACAPDRDRYWVHRTEITTMLTLGGTGETDWKSLVDFLVWRWGVSGVRNRINERLRSHGCSKYEMLKSRALIYAWWRGKTQPNTRYAPVLTELAEEALLWPNGQE